jgi:hypothetical protein
VFDSLADVYPGNEINRSEARQFIAVLRGLSIAHPHRGAALPSLARRHPERQRTVGIHGIVELGPFTPRSNGSRTIRARRSSLIAVSSRSCDRTTAQPTRRCACVGRIGVGSSTGPTLRAASTRAVADAKAEAIFCNMLTDLIGQGRDVSPKPSPTYPLAVFAAHPSAAGIINKDFAAAMERLLSARRLRVEDNMDVPPLRRSKRIVFTPLRAEA